jgi:hypothetical protein
MDWSPEDIGKFVKEAGWGISLLVVFLVIVTKYGKGISDLLFSLKESVSSNTVTNEALKETQAKLVESLGEQTRTQQHIAEYHAITHKKIDDHAKADQISHDETHAHQMTDAERHKLTQELVRAGFEMVRNGLDAIKQVLQNDPTVPSKTIEQVNKIENDVSNVQRKV